MKYESFSYTPIELAESMTSTAHDTLSYLHRNGYLTDEDYDHLRNTIAVYALPNRKGFGRWILQRFFGGSDATEDAFAFPIVEIDPAYSNRKKNKPTLSVIKPKED